MSKVLLRVSIGAALAVSAYAIFAMISRGLDGYAVVWAVIAIGLLDEWRKI